MSTRASHEDLKDLYGPGLAEQLNDMKRDDNLASVPTQDPNTYPVLGIKHRKRASLLKEILRNGGYGDLAREVNIKFR